MITADSVKAIMQGLISKANEITGNEDGDITEAIRSLILGYGTSNNTVSLNIAWPSGYHDINGVYSNSLVFADSSGGKVYTVGNFYSTTIDGVVYTFPADHLQWWHKIYLVEDSDNKFVVEKIEGPGEGATTYKSWTVDMGVIVVAMHSGHPNYETFTSYKVGDYLELEGMTYSEIGSATVDTTLTATIKKTTQIGLSLGQLTQYLKSVAFNNSFSAVTENVVLHLETVTGLSSMFSVVLINAPKITVYISSKCTGLSSAFWSGGTSGTYPKIIEIIGDLSKATTYSRAFHGRSGLIELRAELDFTSAVSGGITDIFYGCSQLEEVRCKANTLKWSLSLSSSPLLSDASIQSIIDCLVDLTDGTAQTLTLHADVKAKLTEAQIASITNKNWTLA